MQNLTPNVCKTESYAISIICYAIDQLAQDDF